MAAGAGHFWPCDLPLPTESSHLALPRPWLPEGLRQCERRTWAARGSAGPGWAQQAHWEASPVGWVDPGRPKHRTSDLRKGLTCDSSPPGVWQGDSLPLALWWLHATSGVLQA